MKYLVHSHTMGSYETDDLDDAIRAFKARIDRDDQYVTIDYVNPVPG